MKILYSSPLGYNHEIVKFGIGIFETMIYRNKKILFLDDHINRLSSSSEDLSIGESYIEDSIKRLKELSIYFQENKVIRLTLSNNGYAIEERDNPYLNFSYESGFNLYEYPYKRGDNPYLRYKTVSYIENYYSRNIAKENGFHDSLFIDYNNNIMECSSSNIIFKRDGRFITPSFSNPILKGIAVTNIIRELKKEFEVVEENINKENLKFMEKAYVCNSVLGIMPVKKIGTKNFDLDIEMCNKINKKLFET